MKRLTSLAVVGVAAATVFAVVTATGGAQQATPIKTLLLDEGNGRSKRIDNPPRGRTPSVGDIYVFNAPLFQNGRRVGQDRGTCTVVSAANFRAQCTDTLQLTGGDLYIQGVFSDAKRVIAGVVGGSSAFNFANGVVIVTRTSSGDHLELHFKT